MSRDVFVREVGLRDGLQLVKSFVPTETKLAWIAGEATAGIPEIEATSFVPPKVIPQFADAAAVAAGIAGIEGPLMCALAPNRKGAELALAAGIRKINFVISVSETHNQANVRRSTDQSFAEFAEIAALRRERPEFADVVLQGGLATAFGCTLEGQVPQSRVLAFLERFLDAGADEVALPDTVGYASPREVRTLFTDAAKVMGGRPLYSHFHDTRGLGLANAVAALEAGVRYFDASLGGLGGCPFAPGATGNIVMEDLVFLLEKEGLRTGVDLAGLAAARTIAEAALPSEKFYGGVPRAGLPKGYAPAGARLAAE